MSKSIQDWTNECYRLAKQKGWHEKDREPGTIHMLMVSEIAEATEEARKGTPPIYADSECEVPGEPARVTDLDYIREQEEKPEGELIELADCVIRIFDYCGKMNWDLEKAIELKHNYNKSRPQRHGGKAF